MPEAAKPSFLRAHWPANVPSPHRTAHGRSCLVSAPAERISSSRCMEPRETKIAIADEQTELLQGGTSSTLQGQTESSPDIDVTLAICAGMRDEL